MLLHALELKRDQTETEVSGSTAVGTLVPIVTKWARWCQARAEYDKAEAEEIGK